MNLIPDIFLNNVKFSPSKMKLQKNVKKYLFILFSIGSNIYKSDEVTVRITVNKGNGYLRS